MLKNYEIVKVIRSQDEKNRLDGLISIKAYDLQFQNSSPLSIYHIFLDGVDKLKDFELFDDDVLLCGYMRSGTTLMQEMIWLILNDFDFDGAEKVIRSNRFPYLEGYEERQKKCGKTDYLPLKDLPRPRAFKTHSPIQCLPHQVHTVRPRIIHISRDVRDVVTSMFYYLRDAFNETQMTFEEYFEKFINAEVLFTPYREHCAGFLKFEYENILYLTYEWVTENIDEAIRRVAKFLDKEVSEENFEKLKTHLKFDSMKNNTACNNTEWFKILNKSFGNEDAKTEGHIRKGAIGGHKSVLTPEMAQRLDNWMKSFV